MKCMRCRKEFQINHPLDAVCNPCLEKNPKLSPQEREQMNLWDKFGDFAKIIAQAIAGEWCWSANSSCKYIDIRLDMRDGGCIVRNRDGKRISAEQLAWQYSRDTPEPPKT